MPVQFPGSSQLWVSLASVHSCHCPRACELKHKTATMAVATIWRLTMVFDFSIDHEVSSSGWHSREGHSHKGHLQRGEKNIGTNSNSHPHATLVRLRYHGHSNPTQIDCLLLSVRHTTDRQPLMFADWQEHYPTKHHRNSPNRCPSPLGVLRCRTPARKPPTSARTDSS